MSASELASLLPLAGEDVPTFAEPWQADAFALVVQLHAKGAFTWNEWAEALANELKSAASRGRSDDGTHYYEHWLCALEALVGTKEIVDRKALEERKVAWADAYRRTPHGKPVRLTSDR